MRPKAEDNGAAHVIEARGLSVHFAVPGRGLRRDVLRAVDGVDLHVAAGETVGLVGESGSGKSTVGRALLGVERLASGDARIMGTPIHRLAPNDRRRLRRHAQMIFQDPLGSMNPRHRVSTILSEPLEIHGMGDRTSRRDRVLELLSMVGLDGSYAPRFPHTMSGGQLQRVAIARALAVSPEIIVCDEPVSALDVSIQAQILNLLRALQRELGIGYLFIAHDLAVVGQVSHRIAVMYLGRIVEEGPAQTVLQHPMHPYTRALRSAIPIPDVNLERGRERIVLRGEIPNPVSPPRGCSFNTRCPWVQPRCLNEAPLLREVGREQRAACHFAHEIEARELRVVVS